MTRRQGKKIPEKIGGVERILAVMEQACRGVYDEDGTRTRRGPAK
jgi:hypothetical protein